MVVYHDFNDHAEGNPLDANFQKREEIWKRTRKKSWTYWENSRRENIYQRLFLGRSFCCNSVTYLEKEVIFYLFFLELLEIWPQFGVLRSSLYQVNWETKKKEKVGGKLSIQVLFITLPAQM